MLFRSKDATVERSHGGELEWVLVYAEVDATDNDCRGNEPCYDGDRIIGLTTSGAWGHRVAKSLAFAYVDPALANPGSTFEIELMGERRPATVLAEAAYDATNLRLRG